ncbi:hypothetical protein AB1Y20_020504 [Prymnesium parvum]|uniref:Prenylcysteine lyase domain-containing protein n=1 Tax=Prymnesium parvum TaxID=97485 RepID=A0AB34JZI9_PRYPA
MATGSIEARVAIVGGGIGGAFAASWLRNATEGTRLHIEVFESASRIGGRTFDTGELRPDDEQKPIELGAAIAIVQNRYVADAAAELGLSREMRSEAVGRGQGLLAIVGKAPAGFTAGPRSLVFEESSWTIQTLTRLSWRYGLRNLARLRSQGAKFIRNFSRLYEEQEQGHAFASVDELLNVGSMQGWPRRSCEEAVGGLVGDRARISEELVAGLAHNNYGQDWAQMGALCCFTAIAPLAAGGSKAAFSVVGGNAGLARGLFAKAGAKVHLAHRVTAVTRTEKPTAGAFNVHFAKEAGEQDSATFDHVIFAAPCPSPDAVPPDGEGNLLALCDRRVEYQPVYVTLVWGLLSPSYFGKLESTAVRALNEDFSDIFTSSDAPTPFRSIGRFDEAKAPGPKRTVKPDLTDKCDAVYSEQPTPRWKLFSSRPLEPTELADIFICHDESLTIRHAWDSPGAYPLSRPRTHNASFILHESERGGLLLHPSAIEAATSAMEVVAVAARNAALLVSQRVLHSGAQLDEVTESRSTGGERDEL